MKITLSDMQNYPLDVVLFPVNQMEKFSEFMERYGNLPDYDILKEIDRIKNQVPKEVIKSHINNLDILVQLEGFVTDGHRERIAVIKNILSSNTVSTDEENRYQYPVQTQFWYGPSLLLWFLILLAIWRRPFRWGVW